MLITGEAVGYIYIFRIAPTMASSPVPSSSEEGSGMMPDKENAALNGP